MLNPAFKLLSSKQGLLFESGLQGGFEFWAPAVNHERLIVEVAAPVWYNAEGSSPASDAPCRNVAEKLWRLQRLRLRLRP